jgi:hypothetical protein
MILNPTDAAIKPELSYAEEKSKYLNSDYVQSVIKKVKDLTIFGPKVLIMAYEQKKHSPNGLILSNFENYQTESGRTKTKLSEIFWQPRGIVVALGSNVSDAYSGISIGDTVLLSMSTQLAQYQFKLDRRDTFSLSELRDPLFLLHESHIEAIEHDTYSI